MESAEVGNTEKVEAGKCSRAWMEKDLTREFLYAVSRWWAGVELPKRVGIHQIRMLRFQAIGLHVRSFLCPSSIRLCGPPSMGDVEENYLLHMIKRKRALALHVVIPATPQIVV